MRLKHNRDFYVYGSKKQDEAKEAKQACERRAEARMQAAATEFLRIVRSLETVTKQNRGGLSHCRKIAAMLGMGKLANSAKGIEHLSRAKLGQAPAELTYDAIALFLVWPREPSLYVRAYPEDPKVTGHHECVPAPPQDTFNMYNGMYITRNLTRAPRCTRCHVQPGFLVDDQICSSCMLMERFGMKQPIVAPPGAPDTPPG